ncbi:Aminoacyl-tRNA synthetase, class II [Cynara cardunculus var. scolymus]|uniref:Aminoacyl-tRNA synthetase, class II n=1 Tax=Cynara cardunculus var. scolymus TaxID=59895 RepID=A0A118JV42_CYNCS|nr:Aminoacyl-tRNA synthetase, class II [Cynara cardunculus var. scolymus]
MLFHHLSSGEVVEKSKTESTDERVGEFRKRLRIVDIKGGESEGCDRLGETLTVRGWVRTLRVQSSVTFIEVNDGSCLSNMQCVIDSDAEGYDQVESGLIATGASICVHGVVVPSQGKKQKIELKIHKLVTVGKSDTSFPIQKKKVTREFLRSKAHLRPRTNTFGAVARVRNALAYATHKFFQENGFVWISSPIITASDCEGAGEQFCVTTLIPSSKEAIDSPADAIPRTKNGLIDWSQDFFEKPAFLTVSGQLNAETYATALSDVYTFGPTFRAENSNTSRHLAEFWMIEPELAFADLNDDMACATAYLQYVDVVEKSFVRLTYTDAVELLLKSKKKFEFPVKWGCDLQSEHERYITEEAFCGCPDIKAFYMRQNDDGKTMNSTSIRRAFGVPHAGFGLGFERLVQFATGLDNIRDTIPFPRAPGSAEF